MITLRGCALETVLTEREKYLRSLEPRSASYVALNTCNRVELYEGSGTVPLRIARHLFRVAAGLESALIGETAILGQIKRAYREAMTRSLSPELHKLFQNALYAGKLARAETGISRGAMSHSQAVIEILDGLKIDLTQARILLIGVNNLNRSALRYLRRKRARTILIANRSYPKAQSLAAEFGCRAERLNALPKILPQTDIVISATSAPHTLITPDKFTARQKILLFDLAVPRDIDPAVGRLPNVELYNNEDIEKIISANRRKRAEKIAAADKIIQAEVTRLYG